MSSFADIISLLEEKRNTLCEIESISNEMRNAPAESLAGLFEKRGELLETAREQGERIAALAEGNDALAAALKNAGEPNSLSPELSEIYDISLRIKSIANRVLREEDGVKEHIQMERDGLLKKIEELNSGSAAIAGNYRRVVQTGVLNAQLGQKQKTI